MYYNVLICMCRTFNMQTNIGHLVLIIEKWPLLCLYVGHPHMEHVNQLMGLIDINLKTDITTMAGSFLFIDRNLS